MMKRILATGLALASVLALCSCNKSDKIENLDYKDESVTVEFDSPEKAYEALSEAVENGDYKAAQIYYRSGAVEAKKEDTEKLYLYSKAKTAYDNGCRGYAMEICEGADLAGYDKAQELYNNIIVDCRSYDGAYEANGNSLYFNGGKVFIGVAGTEHEMVFTNLELHSKDGKFYIAEHNKDGDVLKYELSFSENNLILTSVEAQADESFEGTYSSVADDIPQMYFVLD